MSPAGRHWEVVRGMSPAGMYESRGRTTTTRTSTHARGPGDGEDIGTHGYRRGSASRLMRLTRCRRRRSLWPISLPTILRLYMEATERAAMEAGTLVTTSAGSVVTDGPARADTLHQASLMAVCQRDV